MTLKVEVRKSSNGRLLMVVHFVEDSNFWFHSNGTVSYVPRKPEIELMKESLDAIDTFNMLKRSLRKEGLKEN
jgi:hypothetical protein